MITHELTVTQAEYDVCKERTRQVAGEGWTAEHDDTHANGEIARAAAAYAYEAGRTDHQRKVSADEAPQIWPWAASWWKPTDRRRDLVKAAALIIAEIERLDRLSAAVQPVETKGELGSLPRSKRWASELTDDELAAEQAEVEVAIANGFGERGGSPGEWYYERADEVHREIVKRSALASTGGDE